MLKNTTPILAVALVALAAACSRSPKEDVVYVQPEPSAQQPSAGGTVEAEPTYNKY